MFSPTTRLVTPSEFDFPFSPYDIQQNLMKSLFSVIENKQIGIFESPTGTGKSLTLTCGALKWLQQHNDLVKTELAATIEKRSVEVKDLETDSSKTCDWIESQFGAIQKKAEIVNMKKIQSIMEEYEKTITELRNKKIREKTSKKFGVFAGSNSQDLFEKSVESEDDMLLNDSDSEVPSEQSKDENQYKDTKIFFCSRTHSQLSQVVREIKRTKYGKNIRCVTLASRQNLCIHPEVKMLPMSMLSERCLDMQKCTSKVTSIDKGGQTKKRSKLKRTQTKCPFKNQNAVTELRDHSITEILDIEDLVKSGEAKHSCPYYSVREASKDAQIIMMPYQMLLHRKTRMQAGIDLKNNVVIIDEAHNLLDTLSSIYSAEVNLSQLQLALSQILGYKLKYSSRFLTKNLLKINQIIFVTKRLIKILKDNINKTNSANNSSRMLKTHELMSEGEFFNISLNHLLEFCESTRFAQKIQGFSQKAIHQQESNENIEPKSTGTSETLKRIEENNRKGKKKKSSVPEPIAKTGELQQTKSKMSPSGSVVRPLLAFLETLTECPEDGRVLITSSKDGDETKAVLKFILLNPEGHFNDIVKECRSVIVAGGTMQPVTELTDQLFGSCPERVKLHCYDHVVSDDAVLPLAVSSGPTGKRFQFNFTQRNNEEMIKELGMTLLNICNVIPAGVVCFFGSYDYLETVFSYFKKEEILAKIEQRKKVFREPRTGGGQSIEKMLSDYSKAIKDPDRNGAILFSVVGGKLSEGLNFADNLGRCVIVVGMPYPNKNSPELQEKIKYLNAKLENSAGNEYYDNLCMKAVNQSIGRSVRHIKDYACVLLIDERYGTERVRSKLPIWISRNLKVPQNFGAMQGSIANFFRQKRILS